MQDWNETGDFATAWTDTYNWVELVEGTNTLEMTCESNCDVVIDQLYFVQGHVEG
jgi:hypothetical protein